MKNKLGVILMSIAIPFGLVACSGEIEKPQEEVEETTASVDVLSEREQALIEDSKLNPFALDSLGFLEDVANFFAEGDIRSLYYGINGAQDLIDALDEYDPSTPEFKEFKELAKDGTEEYQRGLELMAHAIEFEDAEALIEASTRMENATVLIKQAEDVLSDLQKNESVFF